MCVGLWLFSTNLQRQLCNRVCVCVCVNVFVKVPMWWAGSIAISLMTAILQMLSHRSQHTANTGAYRSAKTRHKHTHSCTCILMKTFIDTVHSLNSPYPEPNRQNRCKTRPEPLPRNRVLCRSVVKSRLAGMSSLSKMSSLGSEKHLVLTMQEVKGHTHFFFHLSIWPFLMFSVFWSHTPSYMHRHAHTP